MRPPSAITDEDLVLHYYVESDDPEAIAAAIRTTPELERRWVELGRVLDAVATPAPPARSDLYGHAVWRRVYPRLAARRSFRVPRAAGWALAATLLVAIAFWAGRNSAPPPAEPAVATSLAGDRILAGAVAAHLERSQLLLLELANSAGGGIEAAQLARLDEIKAQNRLYRQAAELGGEADIAYVLAGLERFLTELAHVGPGTEGDLQGLVAHLERSDLLFKVRILLSDLERRTRTDGHGATA